MANFQEDAQACISMKYKYPDMLSCIHGQRPNLLNDPLIGLLVAQRAHVEALIYARVDELAGDYDA